MTASSYKTRSKHIKKETKKFKRALFIRTKHNLLIVEVMPFFKLQNNT